MSFISRHRGSKAACGGRSKPCRARQVRLLGQERPVGMPSLQVPITSFAPLPPSPSLPTTGAGCRYSSGCLVQLAHHGCWLQVLFSAQCTVQLKGRLTLRSSAAFFSSSVSSSSRPSLVHEASFLPSYSLSCRQGRGRKAQQPSAAQKPGQGRAGKGRARLPGRLESARRRASCTHHPSAPHPNHTQTRPSLKAAHPCTTQTRPSRKETQPGPSIGPLACCTTYSSMGSVMNSTSYPFFFSFSRKGEFSTALRDSPAGR